MRAPIKSEKEFAKLFRHAARMQEPLKYKLMLLLSVKLGLRPKELAGLQRNWFRSQELRIPLGKSKGKGCRSLPVSKDILEALDEYMQGREGTVFVNREGEPFDAAGVSKAMSRLYRQCGQEGSCYSGRRTMATRMVDEGVNILIIQKVLGHSSPLTTMSYCEVSPNMMQRALFG